MNSTDFPPTIALPGTLMDAASLEPLAAALSHPFRVEILGEKEDFDNELERLLALDSRPAIWLGHSLGGIAAMHLAARYPQRCIALIILASNVRPDGPLGPQTRARQQDALAHGGMVELVRKQLAPVYGLDEQDPIAESLVAQAQRVGHARFHLQHRYAAQRPGLLANSVELSVPVLALSARDDPLCSPVCSEEIMSKVKGSPAEHFTLENAGHLLPFQHPQWCAQHIQTFLTKVF
jgi:pimeloyl-ACP methyl ester carboxylesterase